MAKIKSLLELQAVLGEQIDKVLEEGHTPEEQQTINEKSALIMNLGKQMINVADVTLRYEKLEAQCGKLKNTRMDAIIGNVE